MPTARINNVDIHYRDRGEGEPLLLIHGLGSSSGEWECQIRHFARQYRVISPCLRGFGKSEKHTGPFTVPQFTDDIIALLDHLGVERAHVLGYSMGGAIAFQLAVDQPSRLDQMIILNSQPSFELDHWRKHWMVLARVGMARVLGMARMSRYLAKRMFPEPHQEALRNRMCRRYQLNERGVYLETLQNLAGWTVMDRIGTIDVPTLVVAAEHDYSPLSEKEAYVRKLPDARLHVIHGSRHGTPFDRPEELNEVVLDFLGAGRSAPAEPTARQVELAPATHVGVIATR